MHLRKSTAYVGCCFGEKKSYTRCDAALARLRVNLRKHAPNEIGSLNSYTHLTYASMLCTCCMCRIVPIKEFAHTPTRSLEWTESRLPWVTMATKD
jgi:hypothetical protein